MKGVLAVAIVWLAVVLFTAQVEAATIDIVDVEAPAINCLYDVDCTIVVTDTTDSFALAGARGDALLQTRTFPPGEAGTLAAGLYGYEYRLDLRKAVGVLDIPCISSVRLDFGALAPLDYDGNGDADDVYVITRGGLGSVAPTSADQVGDAITFHFAPPVCAGGAPDRGESSYFFGLTSAAPPQDVTAQIQDTRGVTYTLSARAPSGVTGAAPLDHFTCYGAATDELVEASVFLRDQFGAAEATVLEIARFCNPTAKRHGEIVTPIGNRNHHLTFYRIQSAAPVSTRRVVVSNQFGEEQALRVSRPQFLAVPTQKMLHASPKNLGHFQCYEARGESLDAVVELRDQFQRQPQVPVRAPVLLCTPVEKSHGDQITPIQNPQNHLVCYGIDGAALQGGVTIRNQFGSSVLTVDQADLLCVPSRKISVETEPTPGETPVPGETRAAPTTAVLPRALPPALQKCALSTPDFVVTGSETLMSGDEHCFPSNGAGGFGPRSDILGLTQVDGMDVVDTDGDGDNDFLACDGSTGTVYLYTQGPPNTFVPAAVATGITASSGDSVYCTYLRVADFNTDGQPDFVVGDNRVTNGMFVYLQGPPGVFTAVAPGLDLSWASPAGATCNCLFGVAAGDVNGDTHPDVLVLGYRGAGAAQLRLYAGDGTGGMAPPVLLFTVSADFPIVAMPTGLALFDREGDGDVDILVGGSGDGTHYIYTNDGLGTFTAPSGSAFDVDNFTGIDAYDVDGDSDDDLVLVDWASLRLLYVENLGGMLAAPVPVGTVEGFSIGIGAPPSAAAPPTVLDHFKCYIMGSDQPVDTSVFLRDQFGAGDALVLEAFRFCNPVEKTRITADGQQEVTPIQHPDHHLIFYRVKPADQPTERQVIVRNQFGPEQKFTVFEPLFLAVPTQKIEPAFHQPPKGLDHFKCYRVEGQPVEAVVNLTDQFHGEPEVKVQDPVLLCNPVQKTHGDKVIPIQHPADHLACYRIEGTPFETGVQASNQFGDTHFPVEGADLLCVPSQKFREPQALDHFQCYVTAGTTPVNTTVILRDQFGVGEARVLEAPRFCNPVEKTRFDATGIGTVTPIGDRDHHLQFYRIEATETPRTRVVRVHNQFGPKQILTVSEPLFLAVPTQKRFPGQHQPPQGLDHFKCYRVEGQSVEAVVALRDQFQAEPQVLVHSPVLLCTPVEKIHENVVTPIQHPDDHLTCYRMEGEPFATDVRTRDQFGDKGFAVQRADLLCVPSQKDELVQEPNITQLCGDRAAADFDGGMVLPSGPGTGLFRDNPDGTWPDGRPRRPCGEYLPIDGFLPSSGVTRFRVAYRPAGDPIPAPGTAPGIQTRWVLYDRQNSSSCAVNLMHILQTDADGWMDAATYLEAKLGGPSTDNCPNSGLRLAVWDTANHMGLGPANPDGHYVLWLEWDDGMGPLHKETYEHHLQLDNTLPVINDLLVTLQDGSTPVGACGEAPAGEHLFKVYGDFADAYYWGYSIQVRGGNPPATVTYGWHNYHDGTAEVANTNPTGTTPPSTTVFLRDIDMNDFGASFTDCCYLLELFVRDAAIRHSFNNRVANDITGGFWDDVSQFITFSAAP